MTKGFWVSLELLHDKNTTMQEKLLLVEISQLSMLDKGCIASNNHFAELLQVKKESISRSISSLENKGYITTKIKDGSRNHERVITINKMLFSINNLLFDPKQNVISPLTKCLETKDNISINKDSKGANAPKQLFVSPTLEEIVTYIKESGLYVDANKFFKYYSSSNWKDNRGRAVKNWKLKLISWDKNTDTKKQVYNSLQDLPIEERIIEAERIRQEKIEATLEREYGL